MRTLAKIISAPSLALLLLLPSLSASASNIVFWTFAASLDSGSMAGTTFDVCYSYDADQVTPVGESYVQLNSFDFTLGDAHFTRNDIFQGGQVILTDGVAHDVTASFQVFMPPNSPVNNITFGFGGDGVIGYADLSNQYGDGSFALDAQTPGCAASQSSPARSRSVSRPRSPSLVPSPAASLVPSPARKPPTPRPSTPRPSQ